MYVTETQSYNYLLGELKNRNEKSSIMLSKLEHKKRSRNKIHHDQLTKKLIKNMYTNPKDLDLQLPIKIRVI